MYDPPCHRQSVKFSAEALQRGTYATAAAVAGRSDHVHWVDVHLAASPSAAAVHITSRSTGFDWFAGWRINYDTEPDYSPYM